MSIEAGWYYAAGDPPNTVRRWNGEQWIGFPIVEESHAASAPSTVGVKPFERIHGQVSLSALSAGATVGLTLMIGAHAFLGYTVWQNSRPEIRPAEIPFAPAPVDIVTAFAAAVVVGLLAGVFFIAWFSAAYSNLSRWHHTARSPKITPFVFFVPFVQYRWPWNMMLELIENSARKEKQGAISPLAVLGWWSAWTGHQSLFLASMGLSRWTDFGASSYNLGILGSVVAIVGMCFGIYLVRKISAEQETRRHPSPAQRALMLR